jgi:hypothetical protein
MTRNRGNKKTNEKEYYKSGNRKRPTFNYQQNNPGNFTQDLGRSIISEIDITLTNSRTGEIIGHDYYNSNHHNELSNFYNAFTNTGINTNPSTSRNIDRSTIIPITMYYANDPNVLNENCYLPQLPTTYLHINSNSPNGAFDSFSFTDTNISLEYDRNIDINTGLLNIIDKLAEELFNHSNELTDNDYKQMMDVLKDIKNGNIQIDRIELELYNKINNFINTYITNEDDLSLYYKYFR